MQEFFQAIFSTPMLLPTGIFMLAMVYWLIVMVGAIDIDGFDIDVDIETDADIDVDADVEGGDVAVQGVFTQLLLFFNLDVLPLMVFLSVFALCFWAIAFFGNALINPNFNTTFGLLLLIPNLFLTLFLTKFLCIPFVKLFSAMKNNKAKVDYIGKICTLTLSLTGDNRAQAEVIGEGATSLLINVKSISGNQIKKGEKAIIIEQNKDKGFYLIERLDELS